MRKEKRMQQKREAEIESRLKSKWKALRRRGEEERRQLLDRRFAFVVDDIGAGWEYIHFELDGKTFASYRISYIGPGVSDFVDKVTSLGEEEICEITFYDEPGEYTLLFVRKQDIIYIEIPENRNGFFMKYDVFADRIRKGYKWG